MSFLSIFKRISLDLFFYFAKGARIDAALQRGPKGRSPKDQAYIKPGAEPVYEDGIPIAYNATDVMRLWEIKVGGTLILKNNSKNHAYNLQLLNADEIFDEYEKISKLTSLAPNESLKLYVKFLQHTYANSGVETEKLPDIPIEKQNKYLLIQYENERGTKFLTKFVVSFTEQRNEYTYK
jgi:hypothetical protein